MYGFYRGGRPSVVVSDLDLVRQILTKDFSSFSDRPRLIFRAEPVASTLIALQKDRWKKIRSLLTPLFSMNKMKLFVQAMNEKVDLMVDILKEKTQTDEKIDVYGVFQSLTLDIICQSVLALKSNCQRDPDDLLLVSVRGFLTNAANGAVKLAIYFPFVGRMMAFISNYITYSGRMTANVVSHIKKVLKIRRNMSFEGTPDVVQLMIEAAEMTGDEVIGDGDICCIIIPSDH